MAGVLARRSAYWWTQLPAPRTGSRNVRHHEVAAGRTTPPCSGRGSLAGLRGRAERMAQSMTAMASISTRRSGVKSAATPMSVPGASSLTPSFFSARLRPSCNMVILSGDQSTT